MFMDSYPPLATTHVIGPPTSAQSRITDYEEPVEMFQPMLGVIWCQYCCSVVWSCGG